MKKNHIRNILILTTLTSVTIYGINKSISFSSSLKNYLKSDKGKFYNWRYGNIYYTKNGKGFPLLLIHDLNPMSSDYEWNKIVKQLSKHHTVYTLDLLGCGRSDKPNITYTNFLYVQLITDFIKNIIGAETDVITTGESSSFTFMACHMNHECFNKIIAINPSNLSKLCKSPDKQKNTLKYMIDLPIIGTFFYNLMFSKKIINNIFSKNYFSRSQILSSTTTEHYYESAHLGESRGKYLLSSIKSDYTNINIIHALKLMRNDIYLIGSLEKEGIRNIVDSYLYYNPSIKSFYISDSKYLPQLETAEKLLQIIDSCL